MVVRHGRAGQRQYGIDIVARRGNQWPVGLQCMGKPAYPAERLTLADVENEVAEALKFVPTLKSFYLLTTAPDNADVQNQARLISARHERKGLFEVNVLSWSDLVQLASSQASVVEKHFGAVGGASRAPLLETWFTSKGQLEVAREELAVRCRELGHEFQDFPAGRIVARQRESDEIVAQLVFYEGRPLTVEERNARLQLRDRLAIMETKEARISRGLKLLLSDPTLTSYLFVVQRDSEDAARAVTGFVNQEVGDPLAPKKRDTFEMRIVSPNNPEFRQTRYISKSQLESTKSLIKERNKKFGPGHTKRVIELPDDVRGDVAIPAVLTDILLQLDEGRTLEELRKAGMLRIADWKIENNFFIT